MPAQQPMPEAPSQSLEATRAPVPAAAPLPSAAPQNPVPEASALNPVPAAGVPAPSVQPEHPVPPQPVAIPAPVPRVSTPHPPVPKAPVQGLGSSLPTVVAPPCVPAPAKAPCTVYVPQQHVPKGVAQASGIYICLRAAAKLLLQ